MFLFFVIELIEGLVSRSHKLLFWKIILLLLLLQ